MDYERLYKEALERAREIYQGKYKPEVAATIAEVLQDVFPELKESEDELMRKEAIAIVKQYNIICEREGDKCYTADRVIAWLEKLGETFTKKDVDDAYLKGVCDAKQEFEKQDESIEIKRGKNYLCTKTHKYAGEEWREGIKYFAPADYTLINQGCAYYCPAWSKKEHNNFFKEVGCAEVTPKFKVGDWITDGEYIYGK